MILWIHCIFCSHHAECSSPDDLYVGQYFNNLAACPGVSGREGGGEIGREREKERARLREKERGRRRK